MDTSLNYEAEVCYWLEGIVLNLTGALPVRPTPLNFQLWHSLLLWEIAHFYE